MCVPTHTHTHTHTWLALILQVTCKTNSPNKTRHRIYTINVCLSQSMLCHQYTPGGGADRDVLHTHTHTHTVFSHLS